MSKHFEPRKKKIHSPSVVGAMKTVRIDTRTEIMVPVTLSDTDARERYFSRVQASQRSLGGYKLGQRKKQEEESEEVPQEVLASVVDDSNIPEPE